jgi:phenylacetate-CoA ligase
MFVHPEQIAEVAKRIAGVGRLRLVVGRSGEQDVMTLKAEAGANDPALAERLAEAVNAATKLRATVELVPTGSLPNDGKVIADERTYG